MNQKPCSRLTVRRLTNSGFTLIEIIVVIVILGLLAAVAAPKILGRTDDARKAKAELDIGAFEVALELYKVDNGVFPSTAQGLEALMVPPTIEPIPKKWKKGGYLKDKIPEDPWGNGYLYLSPGKRGEIDIFTYGADGREGGEDVNSDIGSWQ